MSFWGATVITSLATVVPGRRVLLLYLWGSFSLGSPTLRRFFSLHFLLPLLVMRMMVIHLVLLHSYSSLSSFGLIGASFSRYFIWKDLITVMFLLLSCCVLVFSMPCLFMEADN